MISGISKASCSGQLPRNEWQVMYFQKKMFQTLLTSCMKLLAAKQEEEGSKYTRANKVIPDPALVLATEKYDVTSLCTDSDHFCIMIVDPTFSLGDCYELLSHIAISFSLAALETFQFASNLWWSTTEKHTKRTSSLLLAFLGCHLRWFLWKPFKQRLLSDAFSQEEECNIRHSTLQSILVLASSPGPFSRAWGRLYTIRGLDWWTGLVDWTTWLLYYFHWKYYQAGSATDKQWIFIKGWNNDSMPNFTTCQTLGPKFTSAWSSITSTQGVL